MFSAEEIGCAACEAEKNAEKSGLNPMKNIQAQFVIVGEVPCCVCNEPMSQKDVDNQAAIASTSAFNLPLVFTIAHLSHFYVKKDGAFLAIAEYELNMAKFALACGKNDGMLTPEAEKRAEAKIAELEEKLKADDK